MYLHGNGYFIRDLLILSVPRGYSCNFQENDVQIQKQSQLPQTRQGSSRSSGIAGRLLGSRCRHLQHGKRIGSPVAYCYSYFSAMIRHESILGLIALQMWFKNPMPGDLLMHQDSNGSTLQYHPSFRHFRLQTSFEFHKSPRNHSGSKVFH